MKKNRYLCLMEIMIQKFCKKYKLPEKLLFELLSHTTEVHYPKGALVIKEGERDANLYLLKQGFWRTYYLKDGTENSLWFIGPGEIAFSSWGYVNGEASKVNIESISDSIAYCISKAESDVLFSQSVEMANFGRKIFEHEVLCADIYSVSYGTPPTAKERYLTLMEENPELLQNVPLKHLASYLYITPQSLSRIRAELKKK